MIRRNYLKSLMIFILTCLPLLGVSVQQKVTVNVVNASLKQVFSTIENQTPYRFSYKSDIIDHRKDITIRKSGVPVTAVLDAALKGRNLKYSVVSQKSIVVSEKHAKVAAPQQNNKHKMQGVVKDDNGEPVIGATVSVVGTDELAVTDMDGRFTINAAKGAKVKVSYLGFVDREVKASENMNIAMSEDTQALSEVVVVGYGTMKRSDMTGALSSVNTKEMAKRTTTNPAEALQGKVAGVNILRSGGNAGAGVSIKIRGIKTFGDNEPLYIVDGFPGDINSVNPQDIESMEILKDGAAAAIYGSVAANGVVLITTKNGKKGDVKVDFSTYLSFTHVAKDLDMLDADGYKAVHKMMYENYKTQYGEYPGAGLPAYITHETGVNTDWQDAIQRNGLAQNYMVSLRGGGDKAQYSVSYNHADEKGIFIGNEHRHDIARMKLHATKGIIDLDANMDFKYTNSRQPQYSLKETYMISPLVPIYNENEKYGFGLTNFDGLPNNRNVVADNYYKNEVDKKYHTSANVALTFKFFPWLNFKTSYGYRGEHEIDSYHAPDYIADTKSPNNYPNSSETRAYWEEQVFENVLSFNKEIKKHSINAMLGTSLTSRKYNWSSVGVEGKTIVYKVENGQLQQSEKAAGFLDSNFATIGAGAGGTFSGDGSCWKYNRASFFGRLNYNFNDRYLFQFTFREDGSSKFGADSRWGFFPSVAVGWRLSEEQFFKEAESLSFIDNLKLKASYGILGNNNIGNYPYQSTYALGKAMNYVFGGVYTQGAAVTTYVDPTLKWEKTRTTDVGIETAFWNNKLTFNAAYFYRKTTDILYKPSASYSSIFGLGLSQVNTGSLENKGWEFEIGHQNKIGEFSYHVNGNFSIIKNKVISLGVGDVEQKSGMIGNGSDLFLGYPMNMFYGYKTDGVFLTDDEVKEWHDQSKIAPNSKAGDLRYVDISGDGKVDESDKTYLGSKIPQYTFGLGLGAEYKGFDFNILLQGVAKVKGQLTNYAGYAFFQEGNIQKWQAEETWTNNQSNRYPKYPRLEVMSNAGSNNTLGSDFWILDASYLKVRNIQLGYTLPKRITQKFGSSNLRFYISLDNPFSISGYRKGWDPEINTDGSYYPILSTYTFGLTLKF